MFARLKKASEGWVEDQAAQMGAALAYYTLFSLAPLLVIAIAVIGGLLGEAETKKDVVAQVREFLGKESAEAVHHMLENFRPVQSPVAASVIGIASLLFGATGMFTSLQSSLGRIWRLQPIKEGIVMGLVRTYLLAVLMVFVSCTFLMVLLLVSMAMPVLTHFWAARFPHIVWTGPVIDFLTSTVLLMVLFTFTFRFMSDGRIRYGALWSGALVSALLFAVGKMAIGAYLALAHLASAYGAAGSMVVFLAWVYYSAQILFFGAEIVRSGLPTSAPQSPGDPAGS